MDQQGKEEHRGVDKGVSKTKRANNFTMLAYVLVVFIVLGIGLLVILARSKAY